MFLSNQHFSEEVTTKELISPKSFIVLFHTMVSKNRNWVEVRFLSMWKNCTFCNLTELLIFDSSFRFHFLGKTFIFIWIIYAITMVNKSEPHLYLDEKVSIFTEKFHLKWYFVIDIWMYRLCNQYYKKSLNQLWTKN